MLNYNTIKDSRERAHEENMWGKPANDIINGIGNIRTVNPSRGIWELVQNARDVVRKGERAKICFTRNENSFVFQHDGMPFTWKTLEALMLQTSSKSDTDAAQVGQYGTGFLTTHKFGLKFYLSAPLKLSDDEDVYYNIQNFLIDRSATDKDQMRAAIRRQWDETSNWVNTNEKSETPTRHTIFKYICEHEVEKNNVKVAFDLSPRLVPYVLLLNDNIESITFKDNVIAGNESSFERKDSDWLLERKLDNGCVYSTVINASTYFIIKSSEKSKKDNNSSRIIVILPIVRENDKLRAVNIGKDIPQLNINLPLLGTSDWGLDFMFHSPDFTCDTDKRDNLLFVGNGQNSDSQADDNREIIELGKNLIFEFIDSYINQVTDAKYLLRDNFNVRQSEDELGEFYKKSRSEFREKFKSLQVVAQPDNSFVAVDKIKVLDKDLLESCKEYPELLTAIYNLLDKHKEGIVKPVESDMLYWSETLDGWYREEDNPHSLNIDDIAELISKTEITSKDIDWVLEICQYIVKKQRNDLFDKYAIIPNEAGTLHLLKPLLKPIEFLPVVKNALTAMVPEKVELYIHSSFFGLFPNLATYSYKEAKEDLSNYINNHNTEHFDKRKAAKVAIQSSESNDNIEVEKFHQYLYASDIYEAIIRLYESLIPENSDSFASKALDLLLEFYGLKKTENVIRINKDIFDERTFYTTLLYDSLLSFTLLKDKSPKADWCKRMVELLYGSSENKDLLNNYLVYTNQRGNYKYADKLKKQPVDLPDRVVELYDEIACPSESLKNSLVSKKYSSYFVGTAVLSSTEICDGIEAKIRERGYSITNYEKQNLIVEIIEKLSSSNEEEKLWKKLFSDIDDHKGQIMFSIIQSQSKKESIFQIMKVKDDNRLKLIASLADRDDLQELIDAGEQALIQKRNEANDNQYKKDLGEYVEGFLVEHLDKELRETVHVDTKDEQGGQDIIIYKNKVPIYFIEVKSRWANDRSVLMSTMQYQRSIQNPDCYALTCANMYGFDREYVDNHKYPPLEEIMPRIRVLEHIGNYNKDLVKKVDNEKLDPHVNPGYQILVPQDLINSDKGEDFETFLHNLIEKIKSVNAKDGASFSL
jgi:hypothetical protein